MTVVQRLTDDVRAQQVKLARRVRRYAYFSEVTGATGATTSFNGSDLLNFGSNNYLGLATDPTVVEASVEATAQWGAGVTGSRLMNGNLVLHRELEEELAEFYGRESALVFPTGYTANLGLMSTLLNRHDVAYVDREMHASVLDGIAMSRARIKRFDHNDVQQFERHLDPKRAGLCVVEGVYSMRGDHAPIAEFVDQATANGIPLIVDEAHGLGTAGLLGRGVVESSGTIDAVDAITVTFSKSLGSCGGAVIGDAGLIDALRVLARPFIFTASNTPGSLAGALAALRLLRQRPEMVGEVNRLGNLFRTLLIERGVTPLEGASPVVGVEIGSDFETVQAWKMMKNRGVFTNAVVTPATPPGQGLLRMSVMRTHSPEQIERAANVCSEVVSELFCMSGRADQTEMD